ncbi:hypothetical protein [Lysinibacillus sp. NPDC086135]|uniref:hypothetical protein n=1 Tax=Lysinibacillus sp. NPDC086135 TaxID=3364130 RepID=UPI00380B9013
MAKNTQENHEQNQERKKNKWIEWRNQDWLWLVLILCAIIYFVITFRLADNKQVVDLFSFISSSVSIALAVVAIFYAWKQDSDSQVVSRETSKLLTTITTKIEGMDKKMDKFDPSMITNPEQIQMLNEIKNVISNNDQNEDQKTYEDITNIINQRFEDMNAKLQGYYLDDEFETHYMCKFLIGDNHSDPLDFLNDIIKTFKANSISHVFANDILVVTFKSKHPDVLGVMPPLARKYGYHVNNINFN